PADAGAAGIPDTADVALRRGRGTGFRRVERALRKARAVPFLRERRDRHGDNEQQRAHDLHGAAFYCAAAAGAGPFAPSELPSGSVTVFRRPIGAPFFTGCRLTVTLSPTLNELRAHPRLVMSVGLLTSTAQLRTVPVSS